MSSSAFRSAETRNCYGKSKATGGNPNIPESPLALANFRDGLGTIARLEHPLGTSQRLFLIAPLELFLSHRIPRPVSSLDISKRHLAIRDRRTRPVTFLWAKTARAFQRRANGSRSPTVPVAVVNDRSESYSLASTRCFIHPSSFTGRSFFFSLARVARGNLAAGRPGLGRR